jgi:hypothetical protein
MDRLIEGHLVEVTYLKQNGNNQWFQWKMTAVYIGRQATDYRDDRLFSLRPVLGSTSIESKCIMDVKFKKQVRARNTTRGDIVLPRRLPGRVPGPSEINKRTLL